MKSKRKHGTTVIKEGETNEEGDGKIERKGKTLPN